MASETETVEAVRKPGVRVIIHDAYILICCRVQTNLSALVSVHSLSSTSLLCVLIFNNTRNKYFVASSLRRNYSELQTYVTSLILSKKLIFTTSYDVYKHFYSSYLALILLYF